MKNYFKRAGMKRLLMCLIGNLLLGFAVAAFKLSAQGNDPFDGMNMALADLLGIPYPILQIMVNVAMFLVQIALGRQLIGFGTVVNALLLGYIVDFFYRLFLTLWVPQAFVLKLLVMLLGVVICSLGLSLYQSSELGVAPYDALALIMDRRIRKLPYFWCRMITDGACTLVCFLAGGIVGLGTIASVFCFGPVISFFNRTVSEPLLKKA